MRNTVIVQFSWNYSKIKYIIPDKFFDPLNFIEDKDVLNCCSTLFWKYIVEYHHE